MSVLQPVRTVSSPYSNLSQPDSCELLGRIKRVHVEEYLSSHYKAMDLAQCEVVLFEPHFIKKLKEKVSAFLVNPNKHYLFILESEDISSILESLNLTKNKVLSTEVELNLNDLDIVSDWQSKDIPSSKLRVLKKVNDQDGNETTIKLRCQPVLDARTNSIEIINVFSIDADKNLGAMKLSGQFDSAFQMLCDQEALVREFDRVLGEIGTLLTNNPKVQLHLNVPFDCSDTDVIDEMLTRLSQNNIAAERFHWVYHDFASREVKQELARCAKAKGFHLICDAGQSPRAEVMEGVEFVLSHGEPFARNDDQSHLFFARNISKTFPQKAFKEKTSILKRIENGVEVSASSLFYYPAVSCDSIEELVIEQAWVQSSIENLIGKVNHEEPKILVYIDLEDEVPDVIEQLLKDVPTAALLRCMEDVRMLSSETDILIALSCEMRAVSALQDQHYHMKAIVLEDSRNVDDMYTAPIFDPYLIDTYDVVSPYQLFLSRILRKVERKRELAESNNIALESMKQASQYGAIVEFCKTTFQLDTAQELMHGITRFFDNQYGLKIAVMLGDFEHNHYHCYGHQNCPELVQRVLQLVHQKGRIYHYQDNRLVFNDEGICILVLNAPQEEVELGRIKDAGSALITMVGEKWKESRDKQALNMISKQLKSISLDVGRLTVGLKERQELVLSEFVNRIHDSFHQLDFTVDQEDFLLELGGNMAHALNFKSDLDELQNLILGVLQIAKRE